MELTLIQKIVVYALPTLLAITVHEAAHGYAAKFFGDFTAERMGRITLNPFKHIDPMGTVLLPALTILLGGVLFGWAKPVPVNYANLRQPKQDMFWVALAGPASNFLMAIFWVIVLRLTDFLPQTTVDFLVHMGLAGLRVNLVLMVLNLLPMPPLDGGRIAVSVLPNTMALQLSRVEQFGFLILVVLMFTGVLGMIITPIINALEQLILATFL
ncbi:MAG TPA: site-2 protease family protein [Methylophilaceae bacterium]|nr:site-2 protease family protein [Methylophilaceae bacterium]